MKGSILLRPMKCYGHHAGHGNHHGNYGNDNQKRIEGKHGKITTMVFIMVAINVIMLFMCGEVRGV